MALMGLPDWLILAVTAWTLLYLYMSRHRNYWKKQGIVYQKYALIFKPTSRFFPKPFCEADQDRYKKYGKLFGAFEGGTPTLIVAEPDLVKLVLVKDFTALPNRRKMIFFDPILDNIMITAPSEKWRKIRTASSPAFSTGKLRKMSALIDDCARAASLHLKKAAEKKEDIDIKEFCGNYTLDVIARCAFGTKLDSHSDKTSEFLKMSKKAFSGNVTFSMIMLFAFPGIYKFFKMKAFDPDIFLYFKNLCLKIIADRQQNKNRQEDFLQLMMDAQGSGISRESDGNKGDGNGIFNLESELKTGTSNTIKALTENEAMAQCVLFFIAGQEPISTSISFAIYLLALHPEIQSRLREEADECFAANKDGLSLDAVNKLKYLHAVVSETLRMYPPGTRIERSPIHDYVLGDTGITVPKGSIVAVPVYAMHNDPEYFPNPTVFDPERFNDENIGLIRPYTYLPFGAGPRSCIGMQLGLLAVKLSLLHSVHNVQFVRTEKTQVPLQFGKGFGVLSAQDITIGIRPRSP